MTDADDGRESVSSESGTDASRGAGDVGAHGRELLHFRVGAEQFAMAVDAVEAVSDMPAIDPLPTMPPHMLGVCDLRGSLMSVYSPAAALNVPLGAPAVAIIATVGRSETSPGRRVAIAVDEATGVAAMPDARWSGIGGAPGSEGMVRGVSAVGSMLITLVDAGDFLAACTAGRAVFAKGAP